MDFKILTQNIKQTHNTLYKSAIKSVNTHLTLRNLLTGFYIVEYEQKGKDRAEYGTKLLQKLTQKLKIKGLTSPELSRCRQFYNVYFPILGTVSQNSQNILGLSTQESNILSNTILGLSTQELQLHDNQKNNNHFSLLFSSVSFTHFVELIKIKDKTKRKFYELLILKTQPSVKELKKQIGNLAFERVGLSKDTEIAFEQLKEKIEPAKSIDLIKSHYFFDFLNLSSPNLIEESKLEEALISHLQEFIIELGNGFCFEARQKRILIGDEYFFTIVR